MAIAIAVVSVVLALFLAVSGAPKVLGLESSRAVTEHVGLSAGLARFVGACEVAAAVGLIAGLWCHPLAVAAAIGVVLIMIGAVIAHRRVGDPVAKAVPALAVLVLAVVVVGGGYLWPLPR